MIILLIIAIYALPLVFAILRVCIFSDVPPIARINPNSLSSYSVYQLAEKNRHAYHTNAIEETRKFKKEVNQWL